MIDSNTTNTAPFYDFIVAREQVRLNRAAGLPREAWTDDEILYTYKFCNIDREHDAGTIFNREYIRLYYNSPDYLTIARLARTINSPTTLKAMIDDGVIHDGYLDPKNVRDWATEYKLQGGKLWRPAYHSGKRPVLGQTFADWLGEIVRDSQDMNPDLIRTINAGGNADILAAFERLNNVGPFSANQIIMDVAHTPLMSHTDYKDNHTSLGPGSKRGLEELFGDASDYMSKFAELRAGLPQELPRLSLHNIQNCLCEYAKYVYRTETPNTRNKYKETKQ